jgi:ABC-2 type transport system permease protein
MNYDMVKKLILKDWYLQRLAIVLSILGGALSLAIVARGGQAAFTLGTILLVTALVTIGATLGMNLTVLERKEQTLAFVMSLPVSYREYTAAKILANLIIFLIPWLAITAGALGILLLPGATHGLIPFTAIMAVEMLVTTCLIIAAGVITESQAWLTVAILCSSLGLNVLGYVFAHTHGISPQMWGTSVHWTATACTILLAEFLAAALVLAFTFFVQSRKTDFL